MLPHSDCPSTDVSIGIGSAGVFLAGIGSIHTSADELASSLSFKDLGIIDVTKHSSCTSRSCTVDTAVADGFGELVVGRFSAYVHI
jgi:hypothetical protein